MALEVQAERRMHAFCTAVVGERDGGRGRETRSCARRREAVPRSASSALEFSHVVWASGRHGRCFELQVRSGESRRVVHQQAWVYGAAPWFAWQPGLEVIVSSTFVAVVIAPWHDADRLRHEFRRSRAHAPLEGPSLIREAH